MKPGMLIPLLTLEVFFNPKFFFCWCVCVRPEESFFFFFPRLVLLSWAGEREREAEQGVPVPQTGKLNRKLRFRAAVAARLR